MRINLDVLSSVKEQAETQINRRFSRPADNAVEYSAKREAARDYLRLGIEAPELAAEAELMGVSVENLARAILAKTDVALQRGLERRRAVLAVRNAKSKAEIDAVLATLGPEMPI